ncbi:MAG: NAD(P)H-dependent oxidoreductase [Bifidobacteriaceae bacterium]|jgi:chromate reductase|nr:NAD(P)H-dependent oxidoreductase [Bifidobacteriaceae bacterium]
MSDVALISGSLRQQSLNTALLRRAAGLFPHDVETEFVRIDDLPLYSPDGELAQPAAVERLRAQLAAAAAVVVSTPEYNGSVTGALRNALDWASRPYGQSCLAGKPVAVIAVVPSPRAAEWARLELVRSLEVIGARPVGHFGLGGEDTAALAAGTLTEGAAAGLRDLLAGLALQPARA